jgi:Tfp pilus assembly protein PilN
MRPINLLPEKHRSRVPGQGSAGGGHVVLGVLAGALLLMLAVVLTTNSVNAKKDEVTRTETEAKQAEAKAASLQSFGNFAQVKEQRLLSVKALADTRFDWERMVRELAHVVPEDVYLTAADAAVAPAAGATATAAAAPTAGGAVAAGPALKLTGCAGHQPDVAVTMLRLRRLHRATDVQLAGSTRAQNAGGVPAGGSTASPSASGAPACQGFTFEATVAFEASPAPVARPGGENVRVPASLGGGS